GALDDRLLALHALIAGRILAVPHAAVGFAVDLAPLLAVAVGQAARPLRLDQDLAALHPAHRDGDIPCRGGRGRGAELVLLNLDMVAGPVDGLGRAAARD